MTTAGRRPNTQASDNGATTGYEAELWRMADALRGSMDAAEYKHVVLGLIFLKYISDAFEEAYARLEAERDQGADPEEPDEYRAQSIFWVPQEARWSRLKAQAHQPTIGQLVDDAMTSIERDNPALKDVLPKDYARPALDKTRLGQLVDLISNIDIGDEKSRSRDVLGRVYEYFLPQFASAEGKKGGEFYTPRSVVRLLVEMLEPYNGRVYDPCCGSSGMFVQSIEFIRAHATGNGNGGRARADISIYASGWRTATAIAAFTTTVTRTCAPTTSCQSSLQRLRLGRRASPGLQAMAVRSAAQGQRQLCLGAAHGLSPVAQRHGGLRAGQRLHVLQPVRRGRDQEGPG